MTEPKYLKDRQEYIDQYDLMTIKDCLKELDFWTESYKRHLAEEKTKEFSAGDKAKGFNWFSNQMMFQIIGKRYGHKEETIEKWIDQDIQRQNKYDNTPDPQNILCPECKKPMYVRFKLLNSLSESLQMEFLFECRKCKKKRWIYEDGSERESTPTLCPKCEAEVEMTAVKETKDQVVWKTNCKSCGFSETHTDDFKKSRAERDKKEAEEKKLLEVYRKQFCSDEVGKEYFDYVESLKVAKVVYDEELKKIGSVVHQKVSQLKKLSVSDLEKMLNNLLEKEQYIKLTLEKPEIGQHVIVPFSVQDSDTSRRKDISQDQLKVLLKKNLEGTNWRLMSEGIAYRLGYLSGRLKGYENEEELFETSKVKPEKESSKIDHETRMKYEGTKTVRMARFSAEHQVRETMLKRRLEKEPEGFSYDRDEGPYTCGICGDNRYGDEMWYNADGTRCIDCYRNINEGVIPSLGHRHMSEDIYFQDWEISSDTGFGIHPSTAKKLRRDGLLRSRDLKKENGTVYYTVYLVKENQDFLKKYPRKPRKGMTITDLLGNEVEL